MVINKTNFQYCVMSNSYPIVLIKWMEYLRTGLMLSVDFKLHTEILILK